MTLLFAYIHYIRQRKRFRFQVLQEVAELLGLNLKHATTKHAQTIGVLEWAYATVKAFLKTASGEQRKQWHKYLHIAFLNYNTTYHSSSDCEPSRVFYGSVPHNNLDLILGLRLKPSIALTTDLADDLLRKTKFLHDKVEKNFVQSYINYTKYYDKNAKSFPLTAKDFCFILQPKPANKGQNTLS